MDRGMRRDGAVKSAARGEVVSEPPASFAWSFGCGAAVLHAV